MILQVQGNINNKMPFWQLHYLIERFDKFNPTTPINLRIGSGRDQFMFKSLPREFRKDTIFDKLVQQWNSLPLSLRQVTSHTVYKTQLKTLLFKDAFPNS